MVSLKEGDYGMCWYVKNRYESTEIDLYYCKILKIDGEYSKCTLSFSNDGFDENQIKGTFTDVCTNDLVKPDETVKVIPLKKKATGSKYFEKVSEHIKNLPEVEKRELDRRVEKFFNPEPEEVNVEELLHTLWTKAVGTEGYEKKEWERLYSEVKNLLKSQ